MTDNLIKEGDFVYIILDDRRRWIAKAQAGKEFHTHKGALSFDDIIGKEYGICVFSHPLESQGYKFIIHKPLPSDFIIHMARKTQIIYPKDAGLILLYGGINPGCRIVEAGCGSGALTCLLGVYVKPDGHIYSYDIREKSIKQALKNIENARLTNYVSIKFGDIITDPLEHKDIDVVVLDMPQPWKAIENIKDCLKLSGRVVSFSPTIEQVKKTTFALQEHGFMKSLALNYS